MAGQTYESLFDKYQDDYAVIKSESYARWSVPTIFADVDIREGDRVPVQRDYQSVGAILLNYLSSKLTQLLFPANQPFFKLDGSAKLNEMSQALNIPVNKLSDKLAELENAAYRRVFMGSSYHQLGQAMKLLIATGNALIFRDPNNHKTVTYSLRQYAMLRDGAGTVLDIILKERVALSMLPEEVQTIFAGREEYDCLKLWTRIKREHGPMGDVFVVSQQVESYDIGKAIVYHEKICPYIPVVWNLITGENYGRGLVEDYAGDFAKLSELSEELAMYEIEACKVVHLVAPGSGADVDELATAENGAYVQGRPADIQAHEAGDANKIEQISRELQSIFQRLAPAFMYSGNMRDAERVTAEEIRRNAEEADVSFGGNYSAVADNMQTPLAYLTIYEEEPSFIDEVIKGTISLDVLTGVAALGRTVAVQQLLQAANDISLCLPVFAQADKRFDPARIVDIILSGRGIKQSDVFKTEEQLQQELKEASAPVPNPMNPTDATQALQEQGIV